MKTLCTVLCPAVAFGLVHTTMAGTLVLFTTTALFLLGLSLTVPPRLPALRPIAVANK